MAEEGQLAATRHLIDSLDREPKKPLQHKLKVAALSELEAIRAKVLACVLSY